MKRKQQIIIFSLITIFILSIGVIIGLKANFPIIEETPYPTVGDYLDLENLENNNLGDCHLPLKCNDLIIFECNWAGDTSRGPYYYVKEKTGEIVSDCKRFCITDKGSFISFTCPNCPPEEWTCKGN